MKPTATILRNRHRNIYRIVLHGLCVAACGIGISVGAQATDLMETYRLAQTSDPVFASAQQALRAAEQKIPQARAGLLPTLNVTGNSGNTQAQTTFTGTPEIDRSMQAWNWSLQLTQPLVRASNWYAYTQSEYLVAQATAQFEQAKQDLLLRVAQAYFEVIVAQEGIAAAQSQVTALNEQLAQVQRGFEKGTHSLTDVDETRAKLGQARSQRVATQSELESKQAAWERVTGQPPTQLLGLRAEAAPLPPPPQEGRAWMAQAKSSNPLVRAQQAAVEVARREIKKSRAEYLPTLDLVASRGSNYSSSSLTTPTDYSTNATTSQVGVQLTIPLYAGGATNSKVLEAVANMNKAQADLEAASRQAAADAQQAYVGVVNGLAQIEALQSARVSARSAIKGNQVGFKLGIRINSDVLNAEQQWYQVQRDWTKARYDTLLQGLKLKAAIGSLSEEDLQGVNVMLADAPVPSDAK